MKKVCVLNIFVVFILLVFSTYAQAGQVRVSVAKSMSNLCNNLIVQFQEQYPDVKIVPNFGSSGALAKQIEQGAPADIYVSANPKWMTHLIEKGKIESDTKKIFAHNALVFVGKSSTDAQSMSDLQKLTRVALGSPNSVPAGQYAKQAMDKEGIYDEMLKNGQLIMAKDVRQALIYADRGETDGAFVYKTDAMLAINAKILFEVPLEFYSRVTYPVAMTKDSDGNADAKLFYDYIVSEAAHSEMIRLGFTLP
ncbi:molybdate ABC transporter substrate-binding protein [Desulfobacter hydrogenophilus]|uniref:Molybdate ABC transporter substrate-binding protein n=1 Tax=Desulfobacter hydrogenophilus TaxID=2291 RepID=A0A328FB77_9BACT|nr:molybdate ABC transporter substrate-binding protein [Desulfobacter hydrogenophilus]NDY73908.1 molybdate ABC transporter substrate-binding protein [Desulfobacter hydrogenophilus]QBH12070.1 molybdate ABC transporter substrate-binding protein [Desulfobacter hydrogenophilus]RAM00353.1 molybdate ABC transporter substrate-binding protein [Desulfobacter hydrogenophilus]